MDLLVAIVLDVLIKAQLVAHTSLRELVTTIALACPPRVAKDIGFEMFDNQHHLLRDVVIVQAHPLVELDSTVCSRLPDPLPESSMPVCTPPCSWYSSFSTSRMKPSSMAWRMLWKH